MTNKTTRTFPIRKDGQPDWVRESIDFEIEQKEHSQVWRYTWESTMCAGTIDMEIEITVELWNAVEASDNRVEIIRALAEQIRITGLGREMEAFLALWNSFSPTRDRTHAHGGGFYEKRNRVTPRGAAAGLVSMHYPQGFCRGEVSTYDSQTPRLPAEELAQAKLDGEISEYWTVTCYC